jgi:carboxypeptidase C (cathepsin A)
MNGGPGASSTTSLFVENGPLRLTKTGVTNDDYLISMDQNGSWASYSNLLLLD